MVKEDEKALKVVKEDINVEPVEKKTKVIGEQVESQKPIVNKERNIDLQLDPGKGDRDSATVTISRNKLLQHVQQQQQQPNTEKIGKKKIADFSSSFFKLRIVVLVNFFQLGC
jgi:hypothetical protein